MSEKSPPPSDSFFGWLNRQWGYVKKAWNTDVTAENSKTVYRETKVEEAKLPEDPNVTLRRTVVDEVFVAKKPQEKDVPPQNPNVNG